MQVKQKRVETCFDATALNLERRIQERIFRHKKLALFKKYHSEKKTTGRVYSSYGGSPRDGTELEYSVYMVWWEK